MTSQIQVNTGGGWEDLDGKGTASIEALPDGRDQMALMAAGIYANAISHGNTSDEDRAVKIGAAQGVQFRSTGTGPAPVASFTYSPPSPSTTTNVTFDGTSSVPGGAPLTDYFWELGPSVTRSGPVVTWRLPSAHGDVTCTLTVTDAAGLTGQAQQVITI
jgi:hypothetical protein